MRIKSLLSLLVGLLLCAALLPPGARMQQRGLATGTSSADAPAGKYYALVR
jgi:hypothetical protein